MKKIKKVIKYIPRCVSVIGGMELEILEVDENEIFDTEEEARKENKWRCY